MLQKKNGEIFEAYILQDGATGLTAIEINNISLQKAKETKKVEIENYKNSEFAKVLLIRASNNTGNPDYYVKPKPEANIFLAGLSMADNATKPWRAYNIDGEKLSNNDGSPLILQLTKNEVIGAANHYEERKSNEYLQRDLKIAAVDNLSTIEDVEAFDVNAPIV